MAADRHRQKGDPSVGQGADVEGRPQKGTPCLSHRHIFGVKANVKGNVHFTDEAQVLYPAGHNTVQYQMDLKTQRLFPGTEGSEGITCLSVSPNKKFLAVSERFQDRAVCSIFDINTGKRRRALSYDCDAREFVCTAFSAENKFLITQGGPPDWTLILWSWDKAHDGTRAVLSQQTTPCTTRNSVRQQKSATRVRRRTALRASFSLCLCFSLCSLSLIRHVWHQRSYQCHSGAIFFQISLCQLALTWIFSGRLRH